MKHRRRQSRSTRAALIGCGVLTGFGAAANTADIRKGDTVAVDRLRRRRPQRDPGREVQGRGAHHRHRQFDSKLKLGRGVRRDRPRERQGRRRGRRGHGAHAAAAASTSRSRSSGSRRRSSRRSRWPAAAARRSSSASRRWNRSMEIPIAMELLVNEKQVRGSWYGSSNVQRDVPKLDRPLQGGHAQARRARVPDDRPRRHQRGVQGDGSRRGRPLGRRLRNLSGRVVASGHAVPPVREQRSRRLGGRVRHLDARRPTGGAGATTRRP